MLISVVPNKLLRILLIFQRSVETMHKFHLAWHDTTRLVLPSLFDTLSTACPKK